MTAPTREQMIEQVEADIRNCYDKHEIVVLPQLRHAHANYVAILAALQTPPAEDEAAIIHDLERRMYRMFEHGKTNNLVSAQCECQALRIHRGWTQPGATHPPAVSAKREAARCASPTCGHRYDAHSVSGCHVFDGAGECQCKAYTAPPAAAREEVVSIDTGDRIYHKPTREEWVVAYVEGDRIAWYGWPEGTALLSDCELIRKVDPAERRRWLEQMSQSSDGPRKRYADRALNAAADGAKR